MATKVLLPRDIIGGRRLGGFGPSSSSSSSSSAAALFYPLRKQIPNGCSNNSSGGPSPNARQRRKPETRRRREGSPKIGGGGNGRGGTPAMRQVSILRRGESIGPVTGRKGEKERSLGTEPAAAARLVRAEIYAGPAFSLSPSPSALPLPSFSSRKTEEGAAAGLHHRSATRDLRRLLRLD